MTSPRFYERIREYWHGTVRPMDEKTYQQAKTDINDMLVFIEEIQAVLTVKTAMLTRMAEFEEAAKTLSAHGRQLESERTELNRRVKLLGEDVNEARVSCQALKEELTQRKCAHSDMTMLYLEEKKKAEEAAALALKYHDLYDRVRLKGESP